MKTKNKMAALATTAVLILTLAGQSFAATSPFTDLTNIKEKDDILSLQEQGIVKGTGNSLFSPSKVVTAAQGIQFIVNALGLNIDNIRFIKEPKATDYFKKADNDAWYANAFIIASINGLDLPNDLDPSQVWTREEFTYQLDQAIESHVILPKIKLVPVVIKDQDQITTHYDGSIQRALYYGMVKLDAEGKFNPKSQITRAEAAEEIYNALKYLRPYRIQKIVE